MPTYQIQAPNGKTYRIDGPAGATDDQVRQQVLAQYPDAAGGARTAAPKAAPKSPAQKPTSFWQGVNESLSRIAGNMEAINPINAIANAFGGTTPSQRAQQTINKRLSASPYKGSAVGRFVGDVAGTLPTAMLPGGPLVQGAASGYMMTDKRDPASIITNMAMGAAGNYAGQKVVNALAKRAGPQVNKALAALSGNSLTPGQVARGGKGVVSRMVSGAEDRMSSLPGPTGTAVLAGREKASHDFVKGAIKQSLDEIGVELPGHIPAGHEAVAFAQKAASNAYDDALSGMKLVPDEQFASDVSGLVHNINEGGLTDDFASKFEKTFKNVVARRTGGGEVDGDTLKTIISELRGIESKYAGTRGSEAEYGEAIGNLADIIENGALRSSPAEAGQKLLATDKAYAKLVRIEGAAKNAPGGIFSPAQLETSIRQADSSVRKRAIAAGKGLMQDYAAAGREILPSKIGSSGTAERQGLFNPFAWGADLGLYYPYKATQALAPAAARAANSPGNAMLQRNLQLYGAPIAGQLGAAYTADQMTK